MKKMLTFLIISILVATDITSVSASSFSKTRAYDGSLPVVTIGNCPTSWNGVYTHWHLDRTIYNEKLSACNDKNAHWHLTKEAANNWGKYIMYEHYKLSSLVDISQLSLNEEAKLIVRDVKTTRDKAKKIYEFVDSHLMYNNTIHDGEGTVWGADEAYIHGVATDLEFAALFFAMCEVAGLKVNILIANGHYFNMIRNTENTFNISDTFIYIDCMKQKFDFDASSEYSDIEIIAQER